MASVEVRIVEGIDERYVDDALRVAYDAFAKKFRIGFRNADDLIRLFRDSVDRTSCLSATVDGRFAGILTFQTAGREFYHMDTMAVLTRFSPPRAVRVLLNLLLLDEGARPDELIVDSLAVDCSYRGMGIGTALMRNVEERARLMGKSTMSLGVIGGNEGAIRAVRTARLQDDSHLARPPCAACHRFVGAASHREVPHATVSRFVSLTRGGDHA